MYIDNNSLVINNISMGNYITSAKLEFNKLWSSDSGRSLSGKMTGTLIGIFPKIVVNFKPLTKEELNTFAPILNAASQTVKYYDPDKNTTVTMTTYTGDWDIENENIGINKGFQISFIATEKRK